jgi:hypothetical protein
VRLERTEDPSVVGGKIRAGQTEHAEARDGQVVGVDPRVSACRLDRQPDRREVALPLTVAVRRLHASAPCDRAVPIDQDRVDLRSTAVDREHRRPAHGSSSSSSIVTSVAISRSAPRPIGGRSRRSRPCEQDYRTVAARSRLHARGRSPPVSSTVPSPRIHMPVRSASPPESSTRRSSGCLERALNRGAGRRPPARDGVAGLAHVDPIPSSENSVIQHGETSAADQVTASGSDERGRGSPSPTATGGGVARPRILEDAGIRSAGPRGSTGRVLGVERERRPKPFTHAWSPDGRDAGAPRSEVLREQLIGTTHRR